MKKYSGIIFVVLLFIGAATVSLPSDDASAVKLANFYSHNSGIVIITQLIGIVAAIALVIFAKLLAEKDKKLSIATILVAIAGTLPAYPILIMAMQAKGNSDLTTLNHISTYADIILFFVITYFAYRVFVSYQHGIKYFSILVGLSALLRSIFVLMNHEILSVLAPLLFLVLVVWMNIDYLRHRSIKVAKLAQ